ncbi:MAG: hypothetical protein ABSH06_10010 [Thermodesulfobacteriota bacterium]
MVNMDIQKEVKEMVYKRGLRKVARELGIDHSSLYRSVNFGFRVSTMQAILDLLGCELKIVKRKEMKKKVRQIRKQKSGLYGRSKGKR